MVRLQRRLDAGGDRSTYRDHRGQHDARVGGRRALVDCSTYGIATTNPTSRWPATACWAAWSRSRRLRLRYARGGRFDRHRSRDCWSCGRSLALERQLASTIRSARSRSTASADLGSARAGPLRRRHLRRRLERRRRPVRGLLYGDVGQFFAQLIGVTVNIVVVFGLSHAFLQDRRAHDRQSRAGRSRMERDSTRWRWAATLIRVESSRGRCR